MRLRPCLERPGPVSLRGPQLPSSLRQRVGVRRPPIDERMRGPADTGASMWVSPTLPGYVGRRAYLGGGPPSGSLPQARWSTKEPKFAPVGGQSASKSKNPTEGFLADADHRGPDAVRVPAVTAAPQ